VSWQDSNIEWFGQSNDDDSLFQRYLLSSVLDRVAIRQELILRRDIYREEGLFLLATRINQFLSDLQVPEPLPEPVIEKDSGKEDAPSEGHHRQRVQRPQ
jgi:hypothetical protein